ncbi:MAG: sugar ABC transporter substrate-binding protein [Anaerolineae bacterium]|nr:sugar ABC transporter substrate-binding protein [Anaerolineae bacterium]
MFNFKRTLRIVMTLVVVAVMVAPALSASAQAVELRWRTRPDNQAEADVYKGISDEIQADWKDVKLTYEPGGTETAGYQDTLIAEIEAGTAPDVFWIPGTDVARFANAGLILNLAEASAADAEFKTEDFYAGPMAALTTSLDDKPALWGLPRDVSAFAIYYNADLFDEAGVDYPAAGWTWDQFYKAAEAISGLGGDIKGFGMNAWWANWGYFVNSAGSRFFSDDKKSCGLNNEKTVEGLTFARSLFENNLAIPWGTDSEPPFLAGKLGMFLNGRWATPGTIANAKFKWNVGPLPSGPAGSVNWLFWGAYVVNAKTAHPAEAWQLVRRLTSAAIQGKVAALGANLPSRTSAEAVEAFEKSLPDSGVNNSVFSDSLKDPNFVVAETPLFFGDWPAIDQAYGTAASDVLNGKLSPQEFADTICGKVEQFFTK